jgi:hypothetical protein
MRHATPLALVVDVGDGEPLRSDALGELLDRRSDAVGFEVTQPLRSAVDLALADRLREGPVTTDASALDALLAQLERALTTSTDRWFWLASPGFVLGPGLLEERVTDDDEALLSCGFNRCAAVVGDDERELDLRGRATYRSIELRSESASERFGPELARLRARCAQAPGARVTLSLAPRRRAAGRRQRTYVRPKRARGPAPLKTIEAALGPRLEAAGFARSSAGKGKATWTRARPPFVDWLMIEARTDSMGTSLAVALRRDRTDAGLVADTRARTLTPGDASAFPFDGDATAERLWRRLADVGLPWLDEG